MKLEAMAGSTDRARYVPPSAIDSATLSELLGDVRAIDPAQQARLALPGLDPKTPKVATVFFAGDASLLLRRAVAVVGSRKVSVEGAKRSRRIARELAHAGVVVVSGLAEGVDVNAHRAAIEAGGRTIAVIGTPLDQAYPAAHRRLQETIYREHLLISQFPIGSRVFASNFPQRNKIMAAVTDATVIIEASDTSGALHQAAECTRLGRWLFIARSVVENAQLKWPSQFLRHDRVKALEHVSEVLEAIRACP